MTDTFILKRVDDGEEFTLTFGSMLVGRSDSCDIPVKTGQASREHARVRAKEDGILVEDLHSTNGTFVNDKRIEEATLVKPGEVVRFDTEGFAVQRQGSANETIFARPIGRNASGGMSVEEQDEEDANATVYRQTFVMPPGWQSLDDDKSSDDLSTEDRKNKALNNYISKAFRSLSGQHRIALIFSKDDNPPIIKTVATDSDDERWSVGRNQSCDVNVDHPDISDVHCHLIFEDNQWSIEDNQSTNGLWLNNKKQVSLPLTDGKKFHIASVTVEVRIE